jgi:4-amino-4-deoxy-L-arabinose transferase-like glycosyltransferase
VFQPSGATFNIETQSPWWRSPRLAFERNAGADLAWLAPLFVIFLLKGILIIFIVAPFTGHDEVDHFFYIERLAHGHGLGEVGETKLPASANAWQLYVADFPNNAEVIQPPLYHALMVPFYWLVPGSPTTKLYALRMTSLIYGIAVVWLSYLLARLVFPDDLFVRSGVPVFVAFQPQFSYEAAIVNHDIQVILLFSLLVYLLLKWMPGGYSRRQQLTLGIVTGLGIWTKTSFGFALPLIAVCLLFAKRDTRASWRWFLDALVRTCVLPLVIALPWLIRSYWLYGDPTGAKRLHDIPEYGDQASSLGTMVKSPTFWRGRLEDFWGNYGWRLVPFDIGTYHIIFGAWIVAALGLILFLARSIVREFRRRPPLLAPFQARALIIIGLWIVLLITGVLYIGTIQFTQSRFAFPAMIGFAMISVFGIAQWAPIRGRPALAPLLVFALTLLNVIVAIRFLIPFYYGASAATVLTK